MSDQPMWITRLEDEESATLAATTGPLAGLTFAIKDNIDLVGVPTTAADPRRTTPAPSSATAVDLLLQAGAVPLGKANMDQYATGLVGTRSPYGACHSVFSPAHISGGSSSGSAVAVASGEVDFALGTDTAGSGRVPAAFNALVGLKPSRGLVSTTGVVPACASLDCVSVFARTVDVARRVLAVVGAYDDTDPFSRRLLQRPTPRRARVAIPAGDLGLDPLHAGAWEAAKQQAATTYDVTEVDVSAFLETAELLYGGPWVAERALAFGAAMDDDPAVDPTVRGIVGAAARLTAQDAFAAFHQLAALDRRTQQVWESADALLLPTTETHPTHAAVAADPVGVNSGLGRFTNMTNLLDLCAVAFPAAGRSDGLPFGVQLLAPAGGDRMLLDLAARWLGEPEVLTAEGRTTIAVAGAHLSGQPLNADLVARGGVFLETTRTSSAYRMFLVDGPLPRPGLTKLPGSPTAGDGIEVELWSLPDEAVAGFLATIAPPLGLGQVELADGRWTTGFLTTADAVDPARDITSCGGWRGWLVQIGTVDK
ncbi:allophanate hydrolase [Nocardioides sp. Kera G14]|uniref:allophanate hydrolase n=1 Tax=Nocardioides sp. Kera G14 TaxID=2884264 RepID=UPI001D11423F|nr:allophanate hydrolase [Nocardioides sp. Kera G14]UDY24335.1 allophanate hydrolase [Nocardioides sp. Kera G14]